MTRQTFGIPGTLGVLVLLFWLVGWVVFGFHEGLYHALFPIGVVLLIIQFTRLTRLRACTAGARSQRDARARASRCERARRG